MDQNERMIGESGQILGVQEAVSRVAPLNRPVLVVGERGTGKELVAARLHFLSERWGQPYLKINCAAVSESLMESELFGHEAGAFSGAIRQHRGYFERADGGTLFLDELASTSPQVQEKILRLIEYGELIRLGGDRVVQVDVRLVAATNADLPALAAGGDFRRDLLDRLAFDVITLPPLRERPEDIPLLADSFAKAMVVELGRAYFPGFSERAAAALVQYAWPGNARELKNVVERAVYRSEDPEAPVDAIVFDPFDSPWRPRDSDRGPVAETRAPEPAGADPLRDFLNRDTDLKSYLYDREAALIDAALARCRYNQRKAAEFLGLSYHQLRAHLRKRGQPEPEN